ncbi:lytic transglycosylase domain-containing protein [Nocardiopsis sp. CT-R113]|uniref:Lytic transglycosylase domain-containing protein n=1 Tax=Nocardiopsis codii TaxID=3065942 RepID=A0ABU7K6J1_9ACTN|nr:lytic transglycosylase domain-containing protein [Nocardiopsis sp. CT-R113]MEE2037866.1 lytic transglycosylase domain-containing protein [Nocardiopsis sp. CT-R113]
MLLNRTSLRRASAVGAAAVVAGSAFTVAAFAQTGDVAPERLTSAAVVPEQETGGDADDFFAAPSAASEDERESLREETRQEARSAADEGVRSTSGTGSEIPEPEPEPEPETAASGGASDSTGSPGGGAPVPAGSAKEIALEMVLAEGWGEDQFSGCLEPLWEKESNWNHTAENAGSGAYGIPQSLPGSKMASHGDDWRTNPATQIAWGIDYIKDRYGTPCDAWSHSQANNWY